MCLLRKVKLKGLLGWPASISSMLIVWTWFPLAQLEYGTALQQGVPEQRGTRSSS